MLFVAEIASRIHAQIRNRQRRSTFNHWIYMPSTAIEGKCGFDLSIGRFDERRRIRLMHKLICRWCDVTWSWRSHSPGQATKVSRAALHLHNLASQFIHGRRMIRPYLSFTVCFCLHEHRRLGSAGIPAFEDPRRSFFIDVSGLRAVFRPKAKNMAAAGYLKVSNAFKGNGAHLVAQWIRVNGTALRLPVLSWPEFLEEVRDFLLHHR
jgi:hypothetical protein